MYVRDPAGGSPPPGQGLPSYPPVGLGGGWAPFPPACGFGSPSPPLVGCGGHIPPVPKNEESVSARPRDHRPGPPPKMGTIQWEKLTKHSNTCVQTNFAMRPCVAKLTADFGEDLSRHSWAMQHEWLHSFLTCSQHNNVHSRSNSHLCNWVSTPTQPLIISTSLGFLYAWCNNVFCTSCIVLGMPARFSYLLLGWCLTQSRQMKCDPSTTETYIFTNAWGYWFLAKVIWHVLQILRVCSYDIAFAFIVMRIICALVARVHMVGTFCCKCFHRLKKCVRNASIHAGLALQHNLYDWCQYDMCVMKVFCTSCIVLGMPAGFSYQYPHPEVARAASDVRET